MRKKLNHYLIIVLLLSVVVSSCGVFGRSSYSKQCGCPNRKSVG
ncbi:MAG: hypothetical protein ACK4HE_10005 [Chitinophagaceae bacterium]